MLDGEGCGVLDLAGPGTYWLYSSSSGPELNYTLRKKVECGPGRNEHELDLPGGTVVLEGLPALEPKERGEESHYAFVWSDGDGLSWSAYVRSSPGGNLEIGPVPAGEVQLFEGSGGRSGVEPLARVEVAPGGLHRIQLP